MSDPVDSDRNREHDLEPEWDPSVHRLPVWATISEATQAIAKEWKALLKAIAVPTLVLAAVTVVNQLNQEDLDAAGDGPGLFVAPGAFLLSLLLALLSIVPLTMIAVSCHRLVILGADSLPNAWGLFWSWRETRFLGWIIGIWIIAVTVVVVPYLLSVPLITRPLDEWLLFFGILFPLALYVFARLSLVLPATAIGQRPTFKGSWRLTRSNGWRLVLVLSPAILPVYLVFALYDSGVLEEPLIQSRIANDLLLAATLVLMFSIAMLLLSKAFCWFTSESEPSTPS